MPETAQRDVQEANLRPHQFRKGVSGYTAHRERIARTARELAEPFGGLARLSPADRLYVEKAAKLLLRKARSAEDEVRLTNTARSLIAAVERRAGVRGARSSGVALGELKV